MNRFVASMFGLAMLFASIQAGAVVLSLQPSSQTAAPGDAISLDLVVSDLTAGAPDSLGDFDVDIAFDTTALSFTSYVLGTSLGDPGSFEALDFSLGDLGGIVNLSEVSLLEANAATCVFCTGPYLDEIQSDSFSLATLMFQVVALPAGSSTMVDIGTINALGDGYGQSLAATTAGAVISNPATNVPAPPSYALLIIGLIGVVSARRRQRG